MILNCKSVNVPQGCKPCGADGSKRYWRRSSQYDKRGYKTSSATYFDKAVMNQIGDQNARYYDGASGGFANTFLAGLFSNNLIAGNRRRAGMAMATQDAKSIIANLERDADGNIIESVKIITHSMGGAYGKGFAKGLLKYADKNGIDLKIEFEADFAPFQSENQKAVDKVPTLQFDNKFDRVASGDFTIEGAERSVDKDPKKGHTIFDFKDNIEDLPKSNMNGSGSSSVEEKP